ncbi:MAG: hypothetical protein KF809_06295 [Chloroflexi bacterium]|nr:hypothetical protein [Chloroflexota bacterium]
MAQPSSPRSVGRAVGLSLALVMLAGLVPAGQALGQGSSVAAPSIPAAPSTRTVALPQGAAPAPVTGHPRLWLTADDLPRYRSWATDANPLWRDGFWPLVERMTADMDAGLVPTEDTGTRGYTAYPTESYAELFAFVSLVHPNEAVRTEYAQRARDLLMYAIGEAAKGAAPGVPFRDPEFTIPSSDRLRWWGEAWPLTVDWIHPILTAEDRVTIRDVFARWSEEMVTQGYNHPEPVGLVDDPTLFADRTALRLSGNNYFGSHIRNVGMMALALDPEDDPDGELAGWLAHVIGAHLYMNDQLLRTDAAGGMAPEGFEYSQQALAYIVQLQLALRTAGLGDPARWGRQVDPTSNPFWDELIPAFLHSLSPTSGVLPGVEYYGVVYQPAWYGDGEVYIGPDMIGLLGALGRYDELTGNTDRLADIRWVQSETPPGGPEMLVIDRVLYANGLGSPANAILYFMLFDPEAPAAEDPRPDLPLVHFAPGIGRLLARTSWDADAAWFSWNLGWIAIDHQNADGNGFQYWRDGEWLTKIAVGYGGEYGDDDPSDDWYYNDSAHQNTLAIENEEPYVLEPTDYRTQLYLRGSQWEYGGDGDPTILAMRVAPGFVYALGDATASYQSTYMESTDVRHASRSIVWLPPDVIVIYDRAETGNEGQFKRFWLNLTADGTVDGSRATITTASGQQLVVDTLLPEGAVPEVRPLDNPLDSRAAGDMVTHQLVVEAPGDPASTRLLHVLQGADAGAGVGVPLGLASVDGRSAGAIVGTTAVLFPVDVGTPVDGLSWSVPATTTTHLVTGLQPGAGYDVTIGTADDSITMSLTLGGDSIADDAGVLLIGELPAVLGDASIAFTQELAWTPSTGTTPEATDGPSSSDAPGPVATDVPGPAATPGAGSAVEDPGVLEGAGWIVFEATDGDGVRHLYRIEAAAGATPEDLTPALDALGGGSMDEAISISPDGEWLAIGAGRFDPQCEGWPCSSIVRADLTVAETPLVDGQPIHAEGWSIVGSGGGLVVYPLSGGPHALDLWAITREGSGWSQPVLLTGDSPYAFNHTASLSADGTRIVFDCGDEPYAGAGTAICEAGTDGSGSRVVVTPDQGPPGSAADGALHHPDYEPDGSIVFQATWDGALWRVPAGGGAPVRVGPVVVGDSAPCVLADGRIASIWFGREGSEGIPDIKLMTPDGSAYALLLTGMPVEDITCGG